MAEIIASTLIEAVFQKLANEALKQVVRAKGIHFELKKLQKTLSRIQALLNNASNKEITNEAVQVWLNDLQHLAYDIDDVLDDLATEAMCREFTDQSEGSTSMVRKLIPSCYRNFSLSSKMHHKLDDINSKLQDLEKEQVTLGLTVKSGSLDVRDDTPKDKNRQSQTSLVDASSIVGRQVGMGGVGKTTLAKILYEDDQVNDYFEVKAWVCVSDEWDSFTISNIIFQSLTGETREFRDLNLLQVALRDQLRDKLFLLVLDDVWSESSDDWETLVAPFKACAPGSKIIMTTRKDKLLRQLGCGKLKRLQSLSHDDAMCLFAQHALGENSFNSHPRLKAPGEGIVRKCNGLPLALKAVGRLLRANEDEVKWKEIEDSEIWCLEDGGNIIPALRLSYHELPAYLKQLFAYCSLFTKDYAFDKEDLVLLWMAEGFLHKKVRLIKSTIERFGLECFDELLSRSFFQHSPNDESLFVMHDLINDLATSVAGDFFFRLEKEMGKNVRKRALDKSRHMSFVCEEYGAYKKFQGIEGAKGLRTFLSVGVKERWQSNYLSNKVLVDLIPQLQFLRVLSLSGYEISEGLDKVRKATETREAYLSHKRLTELEVEWSDVSDSSRNDTTENDVLDALKPYNECLKRLGIVNYLGLEFPKWVGDPSFRQLARVSIRGCKKCTSLPSLGQLESLKELSIQDMDDVKVLGSDFFGTGLAFPSLEVLSFEGMQGWEVWSTNGTSTTGVIKDEVFPCLKELHIMDCPNLVEISLKALPSLRDLRIHKCGDGVLRSLVHAAPSVTKLDINSISGLTNEAWRGVILDLKAVEELYVKHCHEMRYLWESQEAEASSKVLLNLKRLVVNYCENLVSLGEKDEEEYNYGNNLLTSLRSLEAGWCDNLKHLRCPDNIYWLEIKWCESITCVSFSSGGGQKLKSVSFHGCKKLMLKELREGGEKNRLLLINSKSC
ncbi:hypothetical protein CTI12_AA541380 [Artemisia annua]|uniref:NB-ARC domains-containing protein n=1 Tax=Artemisia annua TaxID=35608 RepID=A0A2U1L1B4_ARTAN|nr:hypothetical protein CTI12_AA541380 [Artemisia annua]